MSKRNFRTLEFSLSIFSVICIVLFLVLGNKLQGDTILWILLSFLILSVFQAFRIYFKEKPNLSEELITKEYLVDVIKYAFKKNRFDTFLKISEILCFVWLAFIYENGVLFIPFVVALSFTTIRSNIENYDKKLIK